MRKKSVLLASVSLALLIGLMGTVAVWARSDAEKNPPHAVARALTEETSAGDKVKGHHFDGYGEVMQSVDAGFLTSQGPSFVSDDEIIREVQALVARWEEAALQSLGWFHVVTQYDREKDTVDTLPNGQPIPLDYVMESWYLLDEQGQATTAVSIMKDMNGREVQVSIFCESMWQNLTLDLQYTGEPFTPRLDFGFGQIVAQAPSWGSTLSRSEGILDDEQVLTFAIHDEFDNPVQIAGFEKPVAGGGRRAYFDPESGETIYVERVLLMADGEERVVGRSEILTWEKVTAPPANVLALLEQRGEVNR